MNPDIFTYRVKHDVAFGQVELESEEYVTLNIPFVEPMSDDDAISHTKNIIIDIEELSRK